MSNFDNGNLANLKDKKVLVVGLGRSGIAAAQALVKLGADVSVQDSKDEYELEPNLITFLRANNVECYFKRIPHDLADFNMIVLSPGVSPELYWVVEAKEQGVEIIGELEIAYRIGKGNYVAITGTNGKTTTTTLVGEIFKAYGRKTYVVGNIGTAVISASAKADESEWLVTEVSSFQLETTRYFKPKLSAILNLTPDHLNRHHTMEAYGSAKAMIFQNQIESDYLIINRDDKSCMDLAKNAKARVIPFSRKERLETGAYVDEGEIVISDEAGNLHNICSVADLKVMGDHNLENVLAAAAICFFSGIDSHTVGETVKAFQGVEHRIEYAGTIDGVEYYNDSKGTNTDAAITAIRALEENIVLIAGGDGKSQDFSFFVKEMNGRVKKLLLLGRDAKEIAKSAEDNGFKDIIFVKDMEEAVRVAAEVSEVGYRVLLSPACASWDMYDNFEQRGRHFKDCVNRLGEK